MSNKKYTASEWAAMYGGNSVETNSESTYQFIDQLSESQLFRTKKNAMSQTVPDAAELVFVNMLLLAMFNNDYDFAPLSMRYADRTMMYSNFNNYRMNATDMYIGLNRLLGTDQEYEGKDEIAFNKIHLKHLDIKRFLAHIEKGNKDDALMNQLLLKFQRDLNIQNSLLRSLRRMVADWDNLSESQRSTTITKLEQFMRANMKRADLAPALDAFKKNGGYSSVEDKKGTNNLAKLATGAAVGYGLYRLGKANRDTSYSKAGSEIAQKYPSRRK